MKPRPRPRLDSAESANLPGCAALAMKRARISTAGGSSNSEDPPHSLARKKHKGAEEDEDVDSSVEMDTSLAVPVVSQLESQDEKTAVVKSEKVLVSSNSSKWY